MYFVGKNVKTQILLKLQTPIIKLGSVHIKIASKIIAKEITEIKMISSLSY